MSDWIRFENYLLGWDVEDTELIRFLKKEVESLSATDYTKFEVEEFFKPLVGNTTYISDVSQIIFEQVETLGNQKTKTPENTTFLDLQAIFHEINILKEPNRILPFLIASWIINIFNKEDKETDQVFEGRVWKSRYHIISAITTYLYRLTTQINIILEAKINFNWNTRNIVFILVHCLANARVFELKTVRTDKKSEIYVSLLKQLDNITLKQNLEIHLEPVNLIYVNGQLFYWGRHYSTLRKVIHSNKASKHTLIIQNFDFIRKRSNLKLFIKWRLLKKFHQQTLELFGLAKDCSAVDFGTHLAFLKTNLWQKNIKKQYSKIFFLKYVYTLEELEEHIKNGFYFTYYFDFRGRVYSDSVIGYTHNRFFRYLYHYGKYSREELDRWEAKLTPINYRYIDYILNNTDIQQKWPNITFKLNITKYYIHTIVFEIGKIFKNKYVSKFKGVFSEKDFITIGIEVFNTLDLNTLEFEKRLEVLALIDILEDLNNQEFYKIPIFKDATASALQILALLLGSNQCENYKICNLTDTDYWHDTYFYIIETFLKTNEIQSPSLLHYFNRSNLKKTIMTFNYEATYLTCWKNFVENTQIIGHIEPQNIKEIETNFKKFYKYLTELFDTTAFFARPSEVILTTFKNTWDTKQQFHFITSDDFIIHYDYYKMIKKRIERIINNNRESIQWNTQTNEVDKQKMFRALRANLIHSFDGLLVRQITLQLPYPIMTIHDSFGIDILSITDLQGIAQHEFQKIYDTDFFNLNEIKKPISIKSPYILL